MREFFTSLILIGMILGAVLLVIPHPKALYSLITAKTPSALPIPVQGVPRKAIVDSWGNPRSGGRKHKGIDIFAKRGTPVFAPVSGLVVGIGQNRLGGNNVRVLGPGLQLHYFAHLDRFGPVKLYDFVQQGDVIGYVGDTGNAKGGPTHLHYGIYARNGAINPYPLLMAGAGKR